MKIRNGFVSNSSSSSFIVAVAKITDENKATSWLESLGLNKYDYGIAKLSDISTDGQNHNSLRRIGNILAVVSFQSEATLNTDDMKDDDKIVWVNIMNDEGDCGRFSGWNEDTHDYQEIDYDIDLDYFDISQIRLYDGLGENNGFTNVDKRYGAGRNG